MEKIDSKNIRQLLSDPDLTIQELLDREDFTSDVRNISSQFVEILNYENIKKVIDWLIKTGPQNDQRSYKFPLVAADLMAMQTPNINQHLFYSEQDKEPLFEYLFRFTQLKEDYTLVGYFSKVVIAIIKRHSNFQSKYNEALCDYLFEKEYINKLINHLYSTSTIDLVIRIFILKSKNKDYYQNKKQFVIKVLKMMENNQLSNEIVENVYYLIEAILSNQTNTSPNTYKSNIQVPNTYQIKLLAYQEEDINILLQSVGSTDRIRKTKARTVHMYIHKYRSNEFYAKYQDKLESYLDKLLQYLKSKAESKEGISLVEVYVLDNLEALLNSPVKSFNLIIADSFDILFQLIINSKWNNIFHQQVERIINQMLSKLSVSKLNEKLIPSLIQFQTKNRENTFNQHQYSQFIIKIGEAVLRISNRNLNQKTEQHLEFEKQIEQIIQNQQSYIIGNSYANPQSISFAYNKQIAVKQHLKFLNAQTIIIYEEKNEEKKEKLLSKNSKKEEQTKPIQITIHIEDKREDQNYKLQEEEYFFVQPQTIIPTEISQSQPLHRSLSTNSHSFKKERIHYQLSQLLSDLDI